MKRKFPVRHIGLALAGVVLLSGFGMVVARSGPLAPVKVTVATVETDSIVASLFGIGTVEARRSYFVGPTAAGRVLSVAVDVGDAVRAGQVLAEMDPVDLDERLRSLQASHARAQSAVAAAEAQRQDARARREVAAINSRRYVELGGKHFVSASAVEGKQQELASAQAATDAAEANLLGARHELVRLQADQQALGEQRRNLRLIAPRDGIVTSRDAEPGSTVVAGQSVLRLIEPDSLWVKVRLDQGRSRGLAHGMAAEVALRSNPSQRLAGKVVRVEPVSDSVTEERIAFVALEAAPAGLTVGELAEVTLHAAAAAPSLVLPNAAIKHTVAGTGVWLLREGRPAFAALTVGDSSLDGRVQVRDTLREGDVVIAHSERELTPDTRIRVVEQLAGGRS